MDVVRLLSELVRIPSVNPMGRALPDEIILESRVTSFMEKYFQGLGIRTQRFEALPGRENLVAFLDPPGNPLQTILFEAHQDTVPVDGMVIEPFCGKVDGGKLFGRGACDVKGGMAAMATAFTKIHANKRAGMPQLIMACTVDEEHGFYGVQNLVSQNFLSGKKAESIWAVVAEPTQLHIVNAHKGAVRWDLVAKGVSCHSSTPHLGDNAIYKMARVLPCVEEYAKILMESKSHPRLGRPTISCGTVRGGTSVNTVPDICSVQMDRRLLPGETPQGAWNDFNTWMKKNCPVAFEVTEPWLAAPALGDELSGQLVNHLGTVIKKHIGTLDVDAVPYGTDAASLAEAGIPTVVFGPGNIAQAHTKDEWIDIHQLQQAVDILVDMVLGVKDS
ncbi:MAG: M20 family metallopeptidase [Gemmataceae bacterium]